MKTNQVSGQSRYMQNLPKLGTEDSFCFSCHPQIECFNACCSDLDLVLHPYDVLRLRRALGMSSRDFLARHCEAGAAPGAGVPDLYLKMRDDERLSCPFVRREGCSVYGDRPGACRSYPVGRGAGYDDEGNVFVQFVLVKEDHCRGFAESKEWKVGQWVEDQEISAYFEHSDRHLDLFSRIQQQNRVLAKDEIAKVMFALYQVDDFQVELKNGKIFGELDTQTGERDEILGDETACLVFAHQWLAKLLLAKRD